jgi:hypothetical protein
MRLSRWLRERPEVLKDAEIDSIFEVARRSSTWKPKR